MFVSHPSSALFGPSYRPSAPGLTPIFSESEPQSETQSIQGVGRIQVLWNSQPQFFRVISFSFLFARRSIQGLYSSASFVRFRFDLVDLGFARLVCLFSIYMQVLFAPAVFCFNPITPVSNPSVFFSVVFFVESFYFSNQIYCTFFNSKKQTAWMLSAKAILTDQAVKTKLLILTLRLLIISPFHTIFLCHFFHYIFCSCSIFDILICTTFFSADILLFCSCQVQILSIL